MLEKFTQYVQEPMTKFWGCFVASCKEFFTNLSKTSIESFGWIGVLCMHAVTIPTLLGIMSGVTDDVPPIDMVLILWAGLAMLYVKAIIQKDMVNIVLIGMGFIGQAILMALVFFK